MRLPICSAPCLIHAKRLRCFNLHLCLTLVCMPLYALIAKIICQRPWLLGSWPCVYASHNYSASYTWILIPTSVSLPWFIHLISDRLSKLNSPCHHPVVDAPALWPAYARTPGKQFTGFSERTAQFPTAGYPPGLSSLRRHTGSDRDRIHCHRASDWFMLLPALYRSWLFRLTRAAGWANSP